MGQLNEQQKRHLRRLGHDLKPVVLIGANGLTDNVLAEIRQALDDHELVKVRVAADDRAQRQAFIARICDDTGASLVQRVGHVALLFRRSSLEKKRRIALP